MISRLFRILRSGIPLFVYFCLATFFAELILLAYLGFSWKINRNKAIQVLAILRDIDLFEMRQKAEGEGDEIAPEQVSYRQILEERAEKILHLQLREQALEDGLQQLAYEQRKLGNERKHYKQLEASFKKELLELQEGAVKTGTDNVRLKLESIKPPQAKDLLVQMLKDKRLDEVVVLLANMPTMKSSKIMSEFKNGDEPKQLYDVLKRIGEGYPEFDLGQQTGEKLAQPNPAGP